MDRHRQSHRDRRAEKRRDLARSTCSPRGRLAKNARLAKRNTNRRERRAQVDALKVMRKLPCLCHEDPDVCPRCDHELTHFDRHTSCPKDSSAFEYGSCQGYRWSGDELSQVYRWLESRRARLSIVELEAEVLGFGSKTAHAHATFHLLRYLHCVAPEKESGAPQMSVATLRRAVCERGVEWSPSIRPLLRNIARRICTHGSFQGASQWSYDLCDGLTFLPGCVVTSRNWHGRMGPRLRNPDDGWWVYHPEEGFEPLHSVDDDDVGSFIRNGWRPLLGIADVDAWCTEILRFFDVFWGPRFLETPQGRWIIGELVKEAIPIRGTNEIISRGA